MSLGTLSASLLGNLLTGKGVKVKIPGRGVIKAGQRTVTSYGSPEFLMSSYP